jgi:imidazolonepropionase-like amidohydrolase
VRDRADRGADVVKVMASGGANTAGTDVLLPQFTVEEIRTVVTEAHARGLPVTAHAHPLSAIRHALAAGVDGIEHCTFLTEHGVDVDGSVVASLVASAVVVCPTMGVAPGVEPPPRIAEFLRRNGLAHGAHAQTVAGLHGAGVRLVAGSDAGISPGKHHGVLAEALIPLVEAAVPVPDVLASATSGAAEACGLATRTGRLAPGLDADLVVLDGDPSADITSLRNVEAVYLRGERVR